MTTAQRLDKIEGRVGAIETRVDQIIELLEGQEHLMADMVTVLKSHSEILAEMRRDNAYTRKLWVAAARKLDLLDELPDED